MSAQSQEALLEDLMENIDEFGENEDEVGAEDEEAVEETEPEPALTVSPVQPVLTDNDIVHARTRAGGRALSSGVSWVLPCVCVCFAFLWVRSGLGVARAC